MLREKNSNQIFFNLRDKNCIRDTRDVSDFQKMSKINISIKWQEQKICTVCPFCHMWIMSIIIPNKKKSGTRAKG